MTEFAERMTLDPHRVAERFRKADGTLAGVAWTLVILGLVCLVFPVFTSVFVTAFLGWLLVIGGVAMLVKSFSLVGAGPFFASMLMSLLTLAVGVMMVFHTGVSLVAITVLLAVTFVVNGVYEIQLALELRPERGWAWMLVSALISIGAGVIVATQVFAAAPFLLGLLIGFNFLSSGIALLAIRHAIKEATRNARAAAAELVDDLRSATR